MASLPTAPKDKPSLPTLPLKSISYSTEPERNSPSCSTPRGNVSWMDSRLEVLKEDDELDEKPGYDYVLPCPCIFKLMQVTVTIVCLGLYSEGMRRVQHSLVTQLFPCIICSIYLIITPVILLSYIMGHRMPELLIRIFNALAGILFFVAGAVALQSYHLYEESLLFQLDYPYPDDDPVYNTLTPEQIEMRVFREGAFLLASGILCLLNSVIYFVDVSWSIHTTLTSL